MKYKLLTAISSAILLASAGSVFAGSNDISCPDMQTVREETSFKFAALQNDDSGWNWELVSQPFTFDGIEWQTSFIVGLAGVMEPSPAIEIGSEIFNKTPFMIKPDSARFGNQTICSYTPKGSTVTMTVTSPVKWGVA